MSKIGKVFTLPSIITIQIRRFPDIPEELFLGWRKDLSSAFRGIHFNTSFGEFSTRLPDSLLTAISFCAHELHMRMPEKDVAREELKAIRESAWALYEEILKSDLPPNLARYLLEYLYLIIEAIDDFEITGAAGLERSPQRSRWYCGDRYNDSKTGQRVSVWRTLLGRSDEGCSSAKTR